VRFAGCCHPVPGDDITGFISRGHGVTVHRSDCVNIRHADPDRIIEVSWADRDKNSSYNAGIKVIGESQTEILSAVLGVVAQMKLSIVSTNGRIDPKNKTAVVDFSIMLNGREELDGLINKLRQVNKIYDVFRTNS
jgi:GTP pyrophosphokinase